MPNPYKPNEKCCDTCHKEADQLFTYALPGVPVTVANCQACVEECAYPYEIALANTACIGGIEHAADWWRNSITYKEGKYIKIKAAFPKGCPEVLETISAMNNISEEGETD